jgi:hypothetical protein
VPRGLLFACVPSQKGLLADRPQRQSATSGFPVGSSHSLPSASTTRTGPRTMYGPFSRIRISTVTRKVYPIGRG